MFWEQGWERKWKAFLFLKCRFSLTFHFQCLVFSHLQSFYSVSLENQLLIFFRALSCGCSFRRGIWEDSVLCYIDSKQALYFQSSTSLLSPVLPLRQVPLVSAGTWTGAYSALPVSVEMRSSQTAQSSYLRFPSVVSCSLCTYIFLFFHCAFIAFMDKEEILLK